jgi:hypothetical protein
MRGSDATSGSLFSTFSLEAEFERLYEGIGRQSIAPKRLLRASL